MKISNNCFFIEKKRSYVARKKSLLALLFIPVFLAAFTIATYGQNVFAQDLMDKVRQGGLDTIGSEVYQTTEPLDLRVMIGNIIKVFLTILTILFMVYLFWAGFRWMTAGGDTKQVDEAKAHIRNAVVGLVIILAAWGITRWLTLITGSVTNTPIST